MGVQFESLRTRRYPAGSSMADHFHETPSLCILIAGDYEEAVRGRSEQYRAGSLSFCPPYEPHAQRIGRSGASKLLLEPNTPVLAFLAEHIRLEEAPAIHTPAAAEIGRRMVAELSINDAFSSIALEGLGQELLALFGRSASQRADVPARWLRDACAYLAEHGHEPHDLRAIAAAVGCDPVRLSRGFRRKFGHTIGQHQRKLRVVAASELLAATRMPLAEIAQSCGFYDQSHLTRVFKAEVGCTPAAFRKRS
ncbi:AraC family transcriptional regulator [Sphingomonas kyeonggiensis]|uniref:AraC family transcriptional regulator n=1 Tax=Sphingomonas kyeonggiensis TaxID=1268553 RepID=A0A7W6JWA1_9SPHN|nr:AraC family transcriptional regulator [Sphingomonas kyeonggiensis]MBB4100725.1 AraC family transcriptional regulator [Sphingomonas kyeonggiensis]